MKNSRTSIRFALLIVGFAFLVPAASLAGSDERKPAATSDLAKALAAARNEEKAAVENWSEKSEVESRTKRDETNVIVDEYRDY